MSARNLEESKEKEYIITYRARNIDNTHKRIEQLLPATIAILCPATFSLSPDPIISLSSKPILELTLLIIGAVFTCFLIYGKHKSELPSNASTWQQKTVKYSLIAAAIICPLAAAYSLLDFFDHLVLKNACHVKSSIRYWVNIAFIPVIFLLILSLTLMCRQKEPSVLNEGKGPNDNEKNRSKPMIQSCLEVLCPIAFCFSLLVKFVSITSKLYASILLVLSFLMVSSFLIWSAYRVNFIEKSGRLLLEESRENRPRRLRLASYSDDNSSNGITSQLSRKNQLILFGTMLGAYLCPFSAILELEEVLMDKKFFHFRKYSLSSPLLISINVGASFIILYTLFKYSFPKIKQTLLEYEQKPQLLSLARESS